MKRLILFSLIGLTLTVGAVEKKGGIDKEMLGRLKGSYSNTGSDKALRNAMNGNEIDKIAVNPDASNGFSTDFSDKVESKGITDQKRSGRCWLFTGQNVLRSQMMKNHDLAELYLSQNYNFFFDQLEKSNLFLQTVIETASLPDTDQTVDWLFMHPLSDGGQYTGVSENFMKYGVVPAEVMRETTASNNTTRLNSLLSLRLRQDGLTLRKMKADGASDEALEAKKEDMLKTVYRMLALTLGEPPTEFTWTRKNSNGEIVSTKTYTPLEFYKEFSGQDLKNDYVMLMNDPAREYYRLYEIDLDRHAFDASNWKYINLPMEDIKKMAISSIKDGKMMYFSCDVGKFLDRDRGVLDIDNFDYESLFGTEFTMDKAERIKTHASASSHAMTLMAVDIDKDGQPVKWMVENSWGPGANDGHLIMTDKWFDEYMFRLVVDKKYVPSDILKILKQEPIMLPAWDPLYLDSDF